MKTRQRRHTPTLQLLRRALLVMVAACLWTTVGFAGGLNPVRLVGGLAGGSGSTVGPDGALYVPEPDAGRISRVDPRTGAVTTFATGLPRRIPAVGVGGAMDIEFIGNTAYVLVTLVGVDVGGSDVVGIYRIDAPDSCTVVADIGEYASGHPPRTAFFIPTGVQYALEKYRKGFLVTDGHHNRVLYVTRDGSITQFAAFDNIVPTGLTLLGSIVFMTQAGPVPHLPEAGKVIAFGPWRHFTWEVASGAPLLVDVKISRRFELLVLSQGTWDGVAEGSPALPFTGSLIKANLDGSFNIIADGLNIPTSMEIIGDTAYVVSLGGEIWKIDDISDPYGGSHHGDRR